MYEANPKPEISLENTPAHANMQDRLHIVPDPDAQTSRSLMEHPTHQIDPMRTFEEIREIEERERQIAKENISVILAYARKKILNQTASLGLQTLPRSWQEQIVKKALAQKPWASTEEFLIEINGETIRIPTSSFDRKDIEAWREETMEEQLKDYVKACEFMKSEEFEKFGGLRRVSIWHERLFEDAFRRNPFARKDAIYPELAEFIDTDEMHAKMLKLHVNESSKNAKAFAASPNFELLGGWEILEEDIAFRILEAIYSNDRARFLREMIALKKIKGETLVNDWEKKIASTYPENTRKRTEGLERVVDIITSDEFEKLGGFESIHPKWLRAIITLAITQQGKNKDIQNAQYEDSRGKTISIQQIMDFYVAQGKQEELDEIIRRAGIANNNMMYHKMDTRPQETPLETQLLLGILAEAKDQKAIWELAMTAETTVRTTARVTDCKQRQHFGEELVNAAMMKVTRLIKSYKYEHVNFVATIYNTLGKEIRTLHRTMSMRLGRGSIQYDRELAGKSKETGRYIMPRGTEFAVGDTDILDSLAEMHGIGTRGKESDDPTPVPETANIREALENLDTKRKFIIKHLYGLGNIELSGRSYEIFKDKRSLNEKYKGAFCSLITALGTLAEKEVKGAKELLSLFGRTRQKDLIKEKLKDLPETMVTTLIQATTYIEKDQALVLAEVLGPIFVVEQDFPSIGTVLAMSRERVRQLANDAKGTILRSLMRQNPNHRNAILSSEFFRSSSAVIPR